MPTTELQAHESVTDRWKANCDARMNWAFDAYKRLFASLSSDVSSRMASAHPEAYVVVFGRTQVGKTTLLLDLMGVNGSSMDRVSAVLRGGRGKGQSATATVMEYGRSKDTCWSLQIPNRTPERHPEDSRACSALGALRHQMESQQLHLDGPVRLEIPCDCFLPVQDGHARVRMLDLPGDQASNPVEQRHVEHVAERYVAGADLILLVGKMDDLSFLQPGGLLLPGIEDWQIVPERFRIVTTFSFTAGSVQASVRRQGLKIEHIRTRLLEQLETFGRLSPDARRTDLLFPLEFGQSMERTAQRDTELVAQIEPVVDALKKELLHQINTAITPMARLRSALRSHLTVAKVKEQKLHEIRGELQVLNNRKASAHADLDVAVRAAVVNAKRHDMLTLRQEQLERASPQSSVSNICVLDESEHTAKVWGTKSVNALQARLDDFRAWVRQSYLELSSKGVDASTHLEWFWREVRPPLENDLPTIRRLLDAHLGSIERLLHGYWTDGYWMDSNYENDVAAVRTAMREAAAECRSQASRRWSSAIEKQLQAHRQALVECERDVYLDQRLIRQLETKVSAASDALIRCEEQRHNFEARMAADQERCLAFTGMLDESYAQQLAEIVERLHRRTNPSFALVDLISGVHLVETRSQLLTTGSPSTSPSH